MTDFDENSGGPDADSPESVAPEQTALDVGDMVVDEADSEPVLDDARLRKLAKAIIAADEDEATDALRHGVVDFTVTIPADFSAALTSAAGDDPHQATVAGLQAVAVGQRRLAALEEQARRLGVSVGDDQVRQTIAEAAASDWGAKGLRGRELRSAVVVRTAASQDARIAAPPAKGVMATSSSEDAARNLSAAPLPITAPSKCASTRATPLALAVRLSWSPR